MNIKSILILIGLFIHVVIVAPGISILHIIFGESFSCWILIPSLILTVIDIICFLFLLIIFKYSYDES